MSRISIGLEGCVCAGKSSVANELALQVPGLLKLPEFMEVLSASERELAFLPNPGLSISLFVLSESRRRALIPHDHTALCVDRSILTLAAFRYAAFKISLIDQAALSFAAERMANAAWIVPTAIFFLDATDATRSSRSKMRDATRPLPYPLLDPTFNAAFREYFERLSRHVPISFVSNEGEESPRQVAYRLLSQTETFSHQMTSDEFVRIAISQMGSDHAAPGSTNIDSGEGHD